MSVLKNRIAAGILSACVMLGCAGYGWTQRPASLPNTDFGEWCVDTAGVLDQETIQLVNNYNDRWDEDYSSVVALAVVDSTRNWEMEEYAQKVGEEWGLGQNDLLLLMDTNQWDYYFVYSYQIMNILDYDDVFDLFYNSEFEDAFYYKHDINKAVESVYEGMDTAYTNGFGAYAQSDDSYISHYDYGFGDSDAYTSDTSDYIAEGIAWALIIWFIVAMIDRSRYKKWYRQHGYYGTPTTNFVPLLFWHKAGSNWYDKMYRKMGGDRSKRVNNSYTTHSTGGQTYSTHGNYSNYRTPGSGYTSETNYRSSGSGSTRSSSGSRGGSFGGSGFSGSGSSRSSSSGSRGGSFGGSGFGGSGSSRSSSSGSRGGSFGGGGFGGSSRGGSSGRGGGFGGRR